MQNNLMVLDGIFVADHEKEFEAVKSVFSLVGEHHRSDNLVNLFASHFAPDELNNEQKILWIYHRMSELKDKLKQEVRIARENEDKRFKQKNNCSQAIIEKRRDYERLKIGMQSKINNAVYDRDKARKTLEATELLTPEQIEDALPPLPDFSDIEAEIKALDDDMNQVDVFKRSWYQFKYRPSWFDDYYLKVNGSEFAVDMNV